MQIIAGKHRGRKLEVPHGKAVRPTSSMAREAIFNVLMHAPPMPDGSPRLPGQVVADLCCGSGAMGLEALSRGASHAIFVDKERASLDLARRSAERFGETAHATFLRADAASLPRGTRPGAICFLDPPYGKGLLPAMAASLLASEWLLPGGWIVAEMAAKDAFAPPPGTTLVSERLYGASRVLFLEALA